MFELNGLKRFLTILGLIAFLFGMLVGLIVISFL